MKRFVYFLLFLCFTFDAQARYSVVVSNQVIEEGDERKARRVAIDQATDQVTMDMVKKEIGEKRFKENEERITQEVQTLKNRFIPFFKIISSNKEGENYHFKIEVKVSRGDLRQVLQQKGLFATNEKTGITMPFVEFNNQLSGESFRWWSPVFTVSLEMQSLAESFEKNMFQGFLEKGLFMLRPQAFDMVHLVPDFMKKTYLTQTEMVQLTSVKEGQLFVDGRVDVITSPVKENALRVRIQLSCKQASNGKSVAEVVRTFDAPSGQQLNQFSGKIQELAKEAGIDIASQVYDLWQRGALEAQVLQLAVTGNLNHEQLARFKKELADTMGLSDGLTERLFEPGRVTFEMDYTGGVDALVRKLSSTKIDGFISQVVSSQTDQITLDVKATQ